MRILSIVHGDEARTELFAPVTEGQGHVLEEWSLAWDAPPPAPIDEFDAFLVFGGAMHADQDDRHPWLRDENLLLQELLDRRAPMLGVCLGAQLIAKAAHAPVFPAPQPEIGWYDVELTDAAADDPVLRQLPRRFEAFQWHYYSYGVPAGAIELARSAACTQAYRLGDAAWGVQFHPEVTAAQVRGWLTRDGVEEGVDVDTLAAQTAQRMPEWNRLGRDLCSAWLAAAERLAVAV